MTPYIRPVLIAATALTLSGCQTMDGVGSSLADLDFTNWGTGSNGERVTIIPQGDCPAVSRVAELASLYQFMNPSRPKDNEKISEAHITRVTSKCAKQGNNLKLDISVNFDGGVGVKGKMTPTDKPSFAYPYFVAITNDKNQILSKEIFAVSFSFDSTSTVQMQVESMSQVVPVGNDDPRTYRILIGYQLSPEELAYNRKLPPEELGKSLTVTTKVSDAAPAGKTY